jgi:hypothetical protein
MEMEEEEEDESRNGDRSLPTVKDNTDSVFTPRDNRNLTYLPLGNKLAQNKFGTSFMRSSRHQLSN